MAGEGPWQRRIEAQRRQLGLNEVEVLGKLPYIEMDKLYNDADVFLFTSLQDTSGTVLLEAMRHGLPVITLDHHGAADIVDCNSGVKVPVRGADQVIDDMATALEGFFNEPRLYRCLSEGALSRIEAAYTWKRKRELIRRIYADAAADV
jgi:glycosyltransferase involved in cell wall biosynthesis